MSDLRVLQTLPAVPVYVCPDPAPAVVPENVNAALLCMAGALDALNQGGYSVEHHEDRDGVPGPYGIVYQAMVDLIERTYPAVDGSQVMRDRFDYEDYSTGVVDALAAALAVRGES